VIQEGSIDRHRVCGTGEGGESRGLPAGYKLFRRPYVVRSCFSTEMCPVGGFSSSGSFELSQSGLLGSSVEVEGVEPFCPLCRFREFFG